MRVEVNEDQIFWLNNNLGFDELTFEQQDELEESVPSPVDGKAIWQCPAFASQLVMLRFDGFVEESNVLLREMKKGIVTGTLNVQLLGGSI